MIDLTTAIISPDLQKNNEQKDGFLYNFYTSYEQRPVTDTEQNLTNIHYLTLHAPQTLAPVP